MTPAAQGTEGEMSPALGQVWASNDWRDIKRGERQRLQIIDVQSGPPYFPLDEAWVEFWNRDTSKRTRVRVRRLRPTSTGYRFVSDRFQEEATDDPQRP